MISERALLNSILDGVEAGLTASLDQIKDDAQKRAPVRKLFRGGGRRRITTGLAVHNYSFRAEPFRRTQRVGVNPADPTGRPIRGRTNSSAPVTARGPAIGGLEFRELASEGKGFRFRLANTVGGREILSRAKSEARRGKGVNTLASGKAGAEYGGTLRDSIEVVGPFRTIEGVTGYVKASAIENGFNYAYAQEFGTAHNAPQPYLRPALRGMFRKIAVTQRDSIRNRLSRQPARLQLVKTSLKLEAVIERSTALARLDVRLTRAGFRAR